MSDVYAGSCPKCAFASLSSADVAPDRSDALCCPQCGSLVILGADVAKQVAARPRRQSPRQPALIMQEAGEQDFEAMGPEARRVAGILQEVRRQLLDMTANNRFLNCRETMKTVGAREANLDSIFMDLVEEGRPIPIAYSQEEHVASGGIPIAPEICLQSNLPEKKLEARLKRIACDSKLAIEETGLNLLYLAFGFLNWCEGQNEEPYRAPLVLVPVSIQRCRASAEEATTSYELRYEGEDLEWNACLAEKLRQFGVELPIPDGDDNGGRQVLKPSQYLSDVEDLAAEKEGWTVSNDLVLGFFQFSKLRMYKDLDPEQWGPGAANILAQALVIDALLGVEKVPGQQVVPRDYDIDADPQANAVPLVVDADSSQLRVLVDALHGKSMVVQGPPGTGKSQTITNLVAATMAAGKTVLFISEKMAALEVVHRNLEKLELHLFCLELHSTRATKKRVHEALKERLQLRLPYASSLTAQRQQIERHKLQLHGYANAISKTLQPINETVYSILGKALNRRSRLPHWFRMPVEDASDLDGEALTTRTTILGDLQTIVGSFGPVYRGVWRGFALRRQGLDTEALVIELFIKCGELLRNCVILLKELDCGCASPREAPSAILALTKEMDARFRNCPKEYTQYGFSLADTQDRAAVRSFIEAVSLFTKCSEELEGEGFGTDWRPHLSLAKSMAANSARACKNVGQGVSVLQGSELADCLQTLLGVAEECIRGSRFLEPLAGCIAQDSMTGIERRLSLFQHLRRCPDIPDLERHIRSCAGGLEGLLTAFHEESSALASEKSRLSELFILDRTPSLDCITLLRAELQKHAGSPRRFLTRSYRWAVSGCRIFTRRASHMSAEHLGGELLKLESYLLAAAQYRGNICAHTLYGALFDGMETPWSLLQEITDWSLKAKSLMGSGYDAESVVKLTKWARGVPTADAALVAGLCEFRKHKARALSLLGRQNGEGRDSVIDSLEDRPLADWKAIAAEMAADLRAVAADVARLAADKERTVFSWNHIASVLVEANSALDRIEAADAVKSMLGAFYCGPKTDVKTLRRGLDWAQEIADSNLPRECQGLLLRCCKAQTFGLKSSNCSDLHSALSVFADEHVKNLEVTAELDDATFFGRPMEDCSIAELKAKLDECVASKDTLSAWLSYARLRSEAQELGVLAFVKKAEGGEIPFDTLQHFFEASFYNSLAEDEVSTSRSLKQFIGLQHDGVRKAFAEADRKLQILQRDVLAADIISKHPVAEGVSRGQASELSERGLIDREMAKVKRHIPIRQLVHRAGQALQGLKPCFMMSPMSVAQFIAPGTLRFDLIVIDEASQLRPEDALGALARGSQIVVVGDPKQLPPTSFFDHYGGDEQTEDENPVQHMESILDAFSNKLPSRMLKWHYRSKHHSLIRFSNSRYYNDELIVFPSPCNQDGELGVKFHYVQDATFGGTPGRNPAEARVVAKAIADYVRGQLALPTGSRSSLGVAAMSLRQRESIEDCLDELCMQQPRLAQSLTEFNESVADPLFIKNLESVQGDERDVIFISCTYGPDAASGRVFQRFGPINMQGGGRRLNVLFSRARKRMEVFSSMHSGDILGGATGSQGARDLKAFLTYAETGSLPEEGVVGPREPDSDFEIAVGREISTLGYQLHYQVGVAGFFLDLAVLHPERTSEFMLGIECDGAAYHSSKSARDRDRLREEIIRSRGWQLHRIWSTDWFLRRPQEINRLKVALEVAASRGRK